MFSNHQKRSCTLSEVKDERFGVVTVVGSSFSFPASLTSPRIRLQSSDLRVLIVLYKTTLRYEPRSVSCTGTYREVLDSSLTFRHPPSPLLALLAPLPFETLFENTEFEEIRPLVVVSGASFNRLLEAAHNAELGYIDDLDELTSELSDLPSGYDPDDKGAPQSFYATNSTPIPEPCTVPANTITSPSPHNASLIHHGTKRPFVDTDVTEPTPGKKPKISNSKLRRNRTREAKLLQDGFTIRPKIRAKLINVTNVIDTKLDTKDLPTTDGIYEAIPLHRSPIDPTLPKLELDALIKAEYKRIEWDGITPQPFVDSQERVIAVLAGRPDTSDFLERTQRLFDKMNQIASKISSSKKTFTDLEVNHFRGDYPAVNVGITPGQGAEKPSFTMPHEEEMKELLEDEDFQKLVKFHSFLVCMWSPPMYQRFRDCLGKLLKHKSLGKKLKSIAPADVYPRVAVNFGPKAWTNRHRDPKDYALAWCIVQSFGRFNPKLGGHVVLDDLRLFIEFPAGSCILLPSATLLHGNLPVRVNQGETRASITQYFPGGLLRYVDHGFKLQSTIKHASRKIQEEAARVRHELWKKDRSDMFMTVRELVQISSSG
ncbi:hypothetical protein NP233_g763 [Leucocoprinus birnbaumii]|uniref:Uncharacterized protein n=1 Tax=Leucocoprinus birnbaumii TaxID=56174 RepID=A0AAD5W1A6_9AGAR|nr:hypothetical protein NP233_g763 [Leucocoprinus birnbaumii]